MSNKSTSPATLEDPLLDSSWNRFWFYPSDPTSLCVMRIVIATIVLYLHSLYLFDLEMFVDEDGVLPVATVKQMFNAQVADDPDASGQNSHAPIDFSIYSYINDPTMLRTMYYAGCAIIFVFALGLFTRVTSILAWIIFISDIHRAPTIAVNAEAVLVILMAYLCIAPSGHLFSIDQLIRKWRTKKASKGKADNGKSEDSGSEKPSLLWSATLATRLMQIHLTVIYIMMVAVKSNRAEWWDGTAVWFISAGNPASSLSYAWLREHSYVLNFLTHFILAYQFIFAVLVWQKKCRLPLLIISVPFWLLMAFVTGAYAFCLVMLTANLAFLPSSTIYELIKNRESKKVVLNSA